MVKIDLNNSRIGDLVAQELLEALADRSEQCHRLAQQYSFKSLPLALASRQSERDMSLNGGTLTWLSLQGCELSDASANAIDRLLRTTRTLRVLRLGYNELTAVAIESMMSGLAANESVRSLDLHGNQLGERGAQRLGVALQRNGALRKVRVGFNEIGDAGFMGLCKAFALDRSMLESLDVSHNLIGSGPMERLAEMLSAGGSGSTSSGGSSGGSMLSSAGKSVCRLKSLDLSWNPLADHGVQLLASALVSNTSLRRLALRHVELTHVSATLLLESVAMNDTLLELELRNNAIENMQALALRLASCRRLQRIDLARTWSTSSHAFAFVASALSANPSVTHISLAKNASDPAGIDALAEALTLNHRVRELDLTRVALSDRGVESLCDMLERNQTLQVLTLSDNALSSEALETLAVSIARTGGSSLRCLRLARNYADDRVAELFIKALDTNDTLESLELVPSLRPISPDKLQLIAKRLCKEWSRESHRYFAKSARSEIAMLWHLKLTAEPNAVQVLSDELLLYLCRMIAWHRKSINIE